MAYLRLQDTDAKDSKITLSDLRYLKTLWPYIRDSRSLLFKAIIFLPFVTLTQLCLPLLLRATIDGPVHDKNLMQLAYYSATFLGVVTLHYLLRYRYLILTQEAGQSIVHQLRTSLFSHLQKLSAQYFTETPTGRLVTRVTADIENIHEVFSSGCIGIFSDAAMILGIFVMMFFLSLKLTLVVLIFCPFLILSVEFLRRRSRDAYNQIRGRIADINIHLQESLSGIEVIQMLNRTQERTESFAIKNLRQRESGVESVIYDSSMTAIIEVFAYSTYIAVVVAFLFLRSQGDPISFGVLIAFLFYVQMVYEPIEALSDKFTYIQSGLASIEKIMEVYEEPIPSKQAQALTPEHINGDVQFKDVSFAYNPETPVLSHVSFDVKAGEKVAIIGRTGAGKSTLIKLLTRLYTPDSGEIQLDSIPLNTFNPDALRQAVIMIPQEDFLFSHTIRDNITMGYNHSVDDNLIWSVLARVQAEEMIRRLPEGLDTILPERGKVFSNGERQLLVFARALWHDPRILILDEATSAIDPKTEKILQAALDETLKGRTAIIVAHRLTTISNVDRVIELKHGKVFREGKPQEILASV